MTIDDHQENSFRLLRGAIGYNQSQRCDTLLYLLVYPQRPMVKTRVRIENDLKRNMLGYLDD